MMASIPGDTSVIRHGHCLTVLARKEIQHGNPECTCKPFRLPSRVLLQIVKCSGGQRIFIAAALPEDSRQQALRCQAASMRQSVLSGPRPAMNHASIRAPFTKLCLLKSHGPIGSVRLKMLQTWGQCTEETCPHSGTVLLLHVSCVGHVHMRSRHCFFQMFRGCTTFCSGLECCEGRRGGASASPGLRKGEGNIFLDTLPLFVHLAQLPVGSAVPLCRSRRRKG